MRFAHGGATHRALLSYSPDYTHRAGRAAGHARPRTRSRASYSADGAAYPEGAPRPANYDLGDSLEPDVYLQTSTTWEVKAADLSLSSTHKGGLGSSRIPEGRGVGLRFPRFIRERDDKPAEHATAHTQIIDMYYEQQSVEKEDTGAAAAEDEDDEFL